MGQSPYPLQPDKRLELLRTPPCLYGHELGKDLPRHLFALHLEWLGGDGV